MTFLSTAFLLALPLVIVPIAIHLYRGRQRDVVMWGAMQFLAAAVTKGRRMERLEELLLMLLRLAAVAALVFALAQPMIRSSWLGNNTDREVILVLDNSLSMSRDIGGRTAGDQMKEKALEVIDSLSGSDGVQILTAAGNEWSTAEPIAADASGKRQLRAIVDDIAPTEGSANLLECLQEAVHLIAPEKPSGRQIAVITDSQSNSWRVDAVAEWQSLAADRDASDLPITISIIECAPDAPQADNLAVTAIDSATHLIRPGEQVDFAAHVENAGEVASHATKLQWLVADKVVQETAVGPLEPHANTQVKATLRLTDPGVFTLTCRLESHDQLPLDQENAVVLEVADQLPVLLVHSPSGGESQVSAPVLFAAALGFKDNQAQPWHSIFKPDVIEPSALGTQPLTSYRAILINNAPLDGAAIERLKSFVRAGGGLWVAIGDQIDRETFNRDWYSDGDGLSPVELKVLEVIDKPDDMAATVHPPSRDHSATVQLTNTSQLDIEEARIRQRWQFAEPSAGSEAVSVLLESGNGHPLVVEKFVGQGRVLMQSFPLDLEWSNVPLLKAYVVMVHDWLDYVTAPSMAHYNLEPGSQIFASPPKDSAAATATLINPRGREIALVAADAELAPTYRYTQTQLPGIYRVRFTSGGAASTELPFHVTRDARESDLQPLAQEDREKLVATAGLHFGPEVAPIASTAETAPRREPFWGILLAALVALLAGELLMSTWLARQRSGLSVSTT